MIAASPRSAALARSEIPVARTEALAFPLFSKLNGSSESFPPLRVAREAFDRFYLEEVLRRAGGNVSTAAKVAGRNRTDFHDLLRRHDLQAADFRESAQRED